MHRIVLIILSLITFNIANAQRIIHEEIRVAEFFEGEKDSSFSSQNILYDKHNRITFKAVKKKENIRYSIFSYGDTCNVERVFENSQLMTTYITKIDSTRRSKRVYVNDVLLLKEFSVEDTVFTHYLDERNDLTYVVLDSLGNQIEYGYFFRDSLSNDVFQPIYFFLRNERGCLKEKRVFTNSSLSIYTYETDFNCNKTKVTKLLEQGNVTITKCNYVYDHNGNWVKSKCSYNGGAAIIEKVRKLNYR